jgi:hypothetical protein
MVMSPAGAITSLPVEFHLDMLRLFAVA